MQALFICAASGVHRPFLRRAYACDMDSLSLSLVDLFWCVVLAAGVTAEVMDRVARRRTAPGAPRHGASRPANVRGGSPVGS